MYTNQSLQVRWSNHITARFIIKNRVKQGGVLSSILLSVYMDGLFEWLRVSGIGYRIGNQYTGGLGYVDDLTLMVPSQKGLQSLIHICENYADEYDVLFNGSKRLFMIFKGCDCHVKNCFITVNNVLLKCANKAVHLGHSLSIDDDDSIVTAVIAQFWRSFNLFSVDFGHISPYLQCKIFKQYCHSFYGAPLWLLSSHIANNACTAWRKAMRKMWRLSPMTHCDEITLITDCIPFEVSLLLRFCKFSSNILKYGSNM